MMGSGAFPGKILLFGEYTVLFGGRALAIPARRWTGSFEQRTDAPVDETLWNWIGYLRDKRIWPSETLEQFVADVNQGLQFVSTIPAGYGLGSSGALCAAAFARYRADAAHPDLTAIREELAGMEAFFHGTSSGMDPLVSLLQRPVLREGDTYTPARLPQQTPAVPDIFLIDSGASRTTTEYVAMFKQSAQDRAFQNSVVLTLTTLAHHSIESFLTGQWKLFWKFLTALSALQGDRLEAFIPPRIQELWQELSGPDICFKLCGAGGGGMFLGFAKTPEAMDRVRNSPGFVEVAGVFG